MANGEAGNNSRKKVLILGLVLVFAACAAGYYLWTKDSISTDDAFVDGHIFSLTPRVAGYVTDVRVVDNQLVKKDALLLTLDPVEYEVAVAEAKANLAEAEATLLSMELGVPLELAQTAKRVLGAEAELQGLRKRLEMKQKEEEAAAQELKRSKSEDDKAALDLRRMSELIKSRAISQSRLDEVQTARETAEARFGSAQARLEAVTKDRASLLSDVSRLQANIELAATGEDQARIRERQVEAQRARRRPCRGTSETGRPELGLHLDCVAGRRVRYTQEGRVRHDGLQRATLTGRSPAGPRRTMDYDELQRDPTYQGPARAEGDHLCRHLSGDGLERQGRIHNGRDRCGVLHVSSGKRIR